MNCIYVQDWNNKGWSNIDSMFHLLRCIILKACSFGCYIYTAYLKQQDGNHRLVVLCRGRIHASNQSQTQTSNRFNSLFKLKTRQQRYIRDFLRLTTLHISFLCPFSLSFTFLTKSFTFFPTLHFCFQTTILLCTLLYCSNIISVI